MGEWCKPAAARRAIAGLIIAMAAFAVPSPAQERPAPEDVLINWNRLVLELVRHTATQSPPVASRAFAYLGITAYEAAASGNNGLATLAGQLNEFHPGPERAPGVSYDDAVVMHAALSFAVQEFFGNTGPTGQRAMEAMEARMGAMVAAGLEEDLVARSAAFGEAIAEHVYSWSLTDGGTPVKNLGFPYDYPLSGDPDRWAPTNRQALQQAPLLPQWGANRTFAMPAGHSCPVPPPPAYSEEPGSAFYAEAVEVYDAVMNLGPEEEAIARFWSDDPMLSPTPPGHWISIALDILSAQDAAIEESVDILARLGIVLADAFIGCWEAKYQFDLVRPVTYINRLIDPQWQPVLITPPFPEYPSGHSTQSGAAAAVLAEHFGVVFAFDDRTHEDEGMGIRSYQSFWEAAEEAAISRLYGGIHFRAAIERGLEQGLCIAAYTSALVTRE